MTEPVQAEVCVHCGNPLLLRRPGRETCEACRLRGGPPSEAASVDVPPPTAGPFPVPEALLCEHDDCTRFVLYIEDPDAVRYSPPLTREERRARGLRTVCMAHASDPG